MGPVAKVLACSLQGGGNVKIRNCRELNGGIFQRSMLIADGTGGNHHITGADIHIDAAAGAHPDKSIRADGSQLLHGDGG